MKIGMIHNEKRKNAIAVTEKVKEFLKKKGISITESPMGEKIDLLISIGGDGTLLKASKIVLDVKAPVLGVNAGNLGFLTEVKISEVFSMLELVLEGKYKEDRRYFLDISINKIKRNALNDLVISKGGNLARIIRVKISSGGNYLNTYRADGIIVASPTGSTAYSLSAGGPIISPNLDVIAITPIAPHTLSARPIIVSGKDIIKLETLEKSREIYVTIDGQENIRITNEDSIEVSLSEKYLSLIKPIDRDYFQVLREKFNWGEKLC